MTDPHDSGFPTPAGVSELTTELADDIRRAIERVLARGLFLLGPELEAFELEFAAACSSRNCVGVGSGTDALALALRACGVGPGDEVIVPSNALPTAFGVAMTGATLRFADVRETDLTIDPLEVDRLLSTRTRAVVPVHLYGQPANIAAVRSVVDPSRVSIVEDCAQAHGGSVDGRAVGRAGDAAAWSFYPTKNLGALGDGGAVTTSRDDIAEAVRSLRMYGETERFLSTRQGVNSRLDEIQAAVLRLKLPHLREWTERRRVIAKVYDRALEAAGSVETPPAPFPECHARHLYPIFVSDRDRIRDRLAERGLTTGIHYPRGAHDQPCFAEWRETDLPITERLCGTTLSLPIHPFVTEDQAEAIAERVTAEVASTG